MAKIYQKIFAGVYDPLMNSFEEGLKANRFELINPLRGRVLEVGSGTGVNFSFYHQDVELIAIEPSMPMLKKAEVKISNDQNISLYNYGVNDPEMDELIEPNSLDAITCTLVLCTIPDPEKALINFKRWLKPGGKLAILEHIVSDNKLNAKLQGIVNPVWKVLGEGCNLTRETDLLIQKLGFVTDNPSYFKRSIRWHQATYILS